MSDTYGTLICGEHGKIRMCQEKYGEPGRSQIEAKCSRLSLVEGRLEWDEVNQSPMALMQRRRRLMGVWQGLVKPDKAPTKVIGG